MKYLITILLICSGLLSCMDEIHLSDRNKIIKQELKPERYKTSHKGIYMYTILEDLPGHNGELLIFTDSIYLVGDTIKFTK